MRERRQIVDLWQRGNAVVLATLILVEGSSYRRAGARLLIAADGDYAGSISGGCLEAEVIRKAAWLVRDGAIVKRYSTLFDDTAEIPYGLGCGGTVDLLLEPANTPEFTALMHALESSLNNRRRYVVTKLPEGGRPLHRWIQDNDRKLIYASKESAATEASSTFDEWLDGPQQLFLFGAGDDARPMVQMAAMLGWRVTVIDRRPQWAKPERFPEAARVLCSGSLNDLSIGRRDAAIIMSHSYEQDRTWLTAVLPLGVRYLGLLGARHRSALLVSEAAAILGWDLTRACDGLFAPVGLDLGVDCAEAIALATIAEIHACCEGKLGVSRRMTPKLIAEQLADGGASRYLQSQCAL